MSVQNVVTYDVVLDVDNSDLALRPGMTATVTLVTGTKADVLKVPLRALRFRPKTQRSREKVVKVVKAVAAASSKQATQLWTRNGNGQRR